MGKHPLRNKSDPAGGHRGSSRIALEVDCHRDRKAAPFGDDAKAVDGPQWGDRWRSVRRRFRPICLFGPLGRQGNGGAAP